MARVILRLCIVVIVLGVAIPTFSVPETEASDILATPVVVPTMTSIPATATQTASPTSTPPAFTISDITIGPACGIDSAFVYKNGPVNLDEAVTADLSEGWLIFTTPIGKYRIQMSVHQVSIEEFINDAWMSYASEYQSINDVIALTISGYDKKLTVKRAEFGIWVGVTDSQMTDSNCNRPYPEGINLKIYPMLKKSNPYAFKPENEHLGSYTAPVGNTDRLILVGFEKKLKYAIGVPRGFGVEIHYSVSLVWQVKEFEVYNNLPIWVSELYKDQIPITVVGHDPLPDWITLLPIEVKTQTHFK